MSWLSGCRRLSPRYEGNPRNCPAFLKGRAEGETRTVPGRPALTRILRQHIEDERLKPGDLLFQGESGGVLAGSVIRRAWRSARKAVLPPHVFESPTGRRVYDNRNTR